MNKTNKEITDSVKNFYENNPYPGLGEKLMMKSADRLTSYFKEPGKILFPGCGTGHGIVSMAKLRPDLKCYGLDLSKPSLEIAEKLAKKHGVNIEFKHGSYMEPLPWDFDFDYITLQGTLHHAADPKYALKNIVKNLKDGGLIHINLYGKKYHKGKFEIIEILNLLQEEDKGNIQQRFELFKSMQENRNKKNVKDMLMDFSLRIIWHWILYQYNAIKNRLSNTVDSSTWHANFDELNQLWIDHFCNPNEKSYDILETKDLIEFAGLEVVDMMSLGKVHKELIPMNWESMFNKLDNWNQYRIMELLQKRTGSVNLVARKSENS